MDVVFAIVYKALLALASWTGLSYKEINIVVYYILGPLVFCVLIDRIIKKPLVTPAWTLIVVVSLFVIDDFSEFSEALFDVSVVFLKSFSVLGLDYIAASVVICVILPAAIFLVLLYIACPGWFKRSQKESE